MSYAQKPTRAKPACFLFLLDQSQAMVERIGGTGERKCDAVALALNAWLNNIILQCSRSDGVRDCFEIAVLSYGTDGQNNPIIRTAFQGELANYGESFLKISQIQQHPSRVVQRVQSYYDDETDQLVSLPVDFVEWFDPVPSGGAPMAGALYQACLMLDQWIEAHRNCFPPIVIHITDGLSTDADPVEYAKALTGRSTDDGNVLLFNCHLSAIAADITIFPLIAEMLPDPCAQTLFQMSSVLPDEYVRRIVDDGDSIQSGSRGLVYNADLTSLLKFLDQTAVVIPRHGVVTSASEQVPYTQSITRATPACFLFLLDQSQAMIEPIGGTNDRRCDVLADVMNSWINNLIIASSKSTGIMDWSEIAVLAYRTDDQGNPLIRTAFQGELAKYGTTFLKISQIHQKPLRRAIREQSFYDLDDGQLKSTPVQVMEWFAPVALGDAPMSAALHQACFMLDHWIVTHRNCFPPIVIHITSGNATDGNPPPYARALSDRCTEDGNVLLFNCHLSKKAADKIVFPHSAELLPDDHARTLFQMSSVLPDDFLVQAIKNGYSLQSGARGYAFNADLLDLIRFLDWGGSRCP